MMDLLLSLESKLYYSYFPCDTALLDQWTKAYLCFPEVLGILQTQHAHLGFVLKPLF